MLKQLCLILTLLAVSTVSLAQDKQGTDSQGNPVILRSDGTWSYLNNSSAECKNYARQSIDQHQTNLNWQCGFNDLAWHGDYQRHYNYCVKATKGSYKAQTKQRQSALTQCSATTNAAPQYLGCYIDKEQRDLKGELLKSDNLTTQTCVSQCRKQGYKYAATQYAKQCFCGNTYGSYGRTSDAECNIACLGNPNQRCGGGWRNSVYQIRP